MELKLLIHKKNQYEKLGKFVRVTFTEEDLMEWARKYIEDRYYDDSIAESLEIESIIP